MDFFAFLGMSIFLEVFAILVFALKDQGSSNFGGFCALVLASFSFLAFGPDAGIAATIVNTIIFVIIIYKQRQARRNAQQEAPPKTQSDNP